MIPKSQWPVYDSTIFNNIIKILQSGKTNYLSGNVGRYFEKKFSNFYNLKYSNAISNASIGLELALLSLNLKNGDEVIVTPRSYYSSVSCVLRASLVPVFADIDKTTMNLCPNSVEKKITNKTKAILCVHLYGLPCDMLKIKKIANRYNLKIIEDCSQAHGSKIGKKYVGTFGDIAVFSFCQDKLISTGGEGGMIATNSKKLYEAIWSLKDIGKNRKKYYNIKKSSNSFPYVHDFIGTNARLTEIQSSIGIHQLKNLKSYVKKRNDNAKIYYEKLKNCKSLLLPCVSNQLTHSFYRYTVILNNNSIKREQLMERLKKKGVSCTVGGCPNISKEKFFSTKLNLKIKDLPNANYLDDKTLSFLVDQTISKEHIKKTCEILLSQIEEMAKS